MNAAALDAPPFSHDEAAYIISTRIKVSRNLDEFPLGAGVSNDQRHLIETKLTAALKTLTGDLAGVYHPLKTLTEAVKKTLNDDHLLFKEGDKFLEAVGLNKDWPNGRGIFHNEHKTFLVWVNEEDQLRVIATQ